MRFRRQCCGLGKSRTSIIPSTYLSQQHFYLSKAFLGYLSSRCTRRHQASHKPTHVCRTRPTRAVEILQSRTKSRIKSRIKVAISTSQQHHSLSLSPSSSIRNRGQSLCATLAIRNEATSSPRWLALICNHGRSGQRLCNDGERGPSVEWCVCSCPLLISLSGRLLAS